ncbi:flagellar motor protein MotB [Neptuniibacter sp. CAU 1671]|uniref:flagellar motor protein MotB n=1 Tax=Neptuniibacter sp. CAU 1671 TaxID=3032593 RepID=UPI0023DAF4C0|nr:flagellar motor protein MotB [Neptuniibacter sp. CAU 1671]MDF2181372.1 flagellar motor protein MotB [Neptuniibacter sp. CAU 1671]
MPRRHSPQDIARHDRWVLSYADFITLLFAFFVVMYAISSVNEDKYRGLAEALTGIFIGLDDSGEKADKGEGHNLRGLGMFMGGTVDKDAPRVTLAPPDQTETMTLEALKQALQVNFSQLVAAGTMTVTGNDLWVAIEVRSGDLFASASATPTDLADQLLEPLAQILSGSENPIHVEGFTDNQPLTSRQFPSNWELSAARAAAVVRLLTEFGVDPKRMAAVGYGEYQPAYSNRTAKGQQLNRRVVIVISRDEKVRRVVTAFGSQNVSSDAVSTLFSEPGTEPRPVVEQVQKEDGGVLFRQAEPDSAGER